MIDALQGSLAALQSGWTHILKIDDTDIVSGRWRTFALSATESYVGMHLPSHYAGWKVWKFQLPMLRRLGRTYHLRKVSNESRWHNRTYTGPLPPTAIGGGGYLLSRRAADLAASEARKAVRCGETCLHFPSGERIELPGCEDVMVALLLRRHGITPDILPRESRELVRASRGDG